LKFINDEQIRSVREEVTEAGSIVDDVASV